MKNSPDRAGLFSESQLCNEGPITAYILLVEILE